MNQASQKEQKKSGVAVSLLVSVGFHAILLALIGGVVLFPGYISQAPLVGSLMEAQPVPDFEPPEEMEYVEDAGGGGTAGTEETVLDTSPVVTEDISNSMDVLTTTALDATVALPTSGGGTMVGAGSIGFGGGSGGGKGGGIGKGVGKGSGSLFGTSIQANKLGVLLDASRTMYTYLPKVIEEVENNFGGSPLVMEFGCDATGSKVNYISFQGKMQNWAPKGQEKSSMTHQETHTYKSATEREGKFKEWIEGASARPNTYVASSRKGTCHLAMEFLIREHKVDAIYWFADFEDYISMEKIDPVLKLAKRNGVKIYVHNMQGDIFQIAKHSVRHMKDGEDVNQRHKFEKIIKETGGEFIFKEL